MADGICMKGQIDIHPTRSPDSTLELCAACEHSLFVHGDSGGQNCLYSICTCPGFTKATA